MTHTPNLFYKIIHGDSSLLAPMSLVDIADEDLGVQCTRPLVLFADQQEALEKSLWFYAHNILPLIGEPNNLPVTVFAAKQYEIDALVSEVSLAGVFLNRLAMEYNADQVSSITLIGSAFLVGDLQPLMNVGRTVKAVLARPGMGAFAESCSMSLEKEILVFHPDSTAKLLFEGREILVIKKTEPIYPARRVKTGIYAIPNPILCPCGRVPGFTLLSNR